jgi:hypothetical protein
VKALPEPAMMANLIRASRIRAHIPGLSLGCVLPGYCIRQIQGRVKHRCRRREDEHLRPDRQTVVDGQGLGA